MRSPVVATLTISLFVWILGSGPAEASAGINRWNGFSSTAFTQGFVRNLCPGWAMCQNDDFDLTGGSDAQCPTPAFGEEGLQPPCLTTVFAYRDALLHVNGFAARFPEPGGDIFVGTNAQIRAERIDDLLVLNGQIQTTGLAPGTVQLAVFRYAGDPSVFDGIEIDRVEELVDLGVITSDDILAALLYTNDSNVHTSVPVAGLVDEEIVLFAAGDARIPGVVPATNVVGTTLLIVAMLGLGTWVVRRRMARVD